MTANQAAAEVRHKILRKMSELDKLPSSRFVWDELRKYINGMAKRASAKPGGLGRKR